MGEEKGEHLKSIKPLPMNEINTLTPFLCKEYRIK